MPFCPYFARPPGLPDTLSSHLESARLIHIDHWARSIGHEEYEEHRMLDAVDQQAASRPPSTYDNYLCPQPFTYRSLSPDCTTATTDSDETYGNTHKVDVAIDDENRSVSHCTYTGIPKDDDREDSIHKGLARAWSSVLHNSQRVPLTPELSGTLSASSESSKTGPWCKDLHRAGFTNRDDLESMDSSCSFSPKKKVFDEVEWLKANPTYNLMVPKQ
nr:hypothetical protein CFP56_44348 [Quercus suber]